MSRAAAVFLKDLRLVLGGGGYVQGFLLGLLLIFVFSLSSPIGERISAQAAATVFWLASTFCLVLIYNLLFSLEEEDDVRLALVMAPVSLPLIWLAKAAAGWVLLLVSQIVFFPAIVVFMNQTPGGDMASGVLATALADWGLVVLGALLGALSQGKNARDTLLTILLFPLLLPVLLSGISLLGAAFSGHAMTAQGNWFFIILAFDAIFTGAGLLLFPVLFKAA